MKINKPVTNNEVKVPKNKFIVSKTDLKGTIIEVNDTFLEVSGFSKSELFGKNHNIVRHPDVPTEAFRDLWDTLQRGKPWTQIVKNRCKNGDYYWVRANVAPIVENGETTGYMSVRTGATDAEIKAAESAYKLLDSGAVSLYEGHPITGFGKFMHKINLINKLSMRQLVVIGASLGMLLSILSIISIFSDSTSMQSTLFTLMTLMMFLSSVIALPVLGSLLSRIDSISAILDKIKEGNFHEIVAASVRDDEFSKLINSVRSMQIQLGFNFIDMQENLDNTRRITTALENASTSIMVADENRNVVYMNRAVRDLLRKSEHAIKKDIPTFSSGEVIGGSIDRFHKEPEKQAKLLKSLNGKHEVQAEIGGRNFIIKASSIIDDEGESIGSVAEWNDITEELSAQQEVQSMVKAAGQGKLNHRIDASMYDEGFMKELAESLNGLLAAIEAPVENIATAISHLSTGDLNQKINDGYQGRFGVLAESYNYTAANLRRVIKEVRMAASEVSTASKEISDGNLDLSKRTESQAASLVETSTTMEEMNSTVQQNANNSMEAKQMTGTVRDNAKESGAVMTDAIEAMDGITEVSKKIADITTVIDSIAFQTNLLALNAAVEAARAGEQGRGFAVVAGEVRNLAQRSAEAAKEIKTLIEDSVDKVDSGTKLVNSAGKVLDDVVGSIVSINDVIVDISAASQEQEVGIGQINIAVQQLDEVTQQNAALVEEASAASTSLSEQAELLKNKVGFFSIDESLDTTTSDISDSMDFGLDDSSADDQDFFI